MNTQNKNARAAIVAKYMPPTNHKGARIKVITQRGSKLFAYPYELSGVECFVSCVDQYLAFIEAEDVKKYGSSCGGWGKIGEYSVGVLPTGEHVFVSND